MVSGEMEQGITLPDAFVKSTRQLMGEERFARFLSSFEEETPVSIRLNPRMVDDADSHPSLQRVPWCPTGYYLHTRPNFTFDPLLHAGCYYVQEAASMFLHKVLAAYLPPLASRLSPLTSLDLCAAPGGKSTLLRSLLPAGSMLYCNEPVRQRACILSENIQKWGYEGCIVTNSYPRDYVQSGLLFDLILCDVPCSGEGMFRKDPQTIGEWSPQQVEKCWRLQRDIVSDAWQCLRPGGLLIYSTCTFNIKEDEENVCWMVDEFGAELLSVPTDPSWGITGSLLPGFAGPVYRFIPGVTRSEGLFISVLRKRDGVPPASTVSGASLVLGTSGASPASTVSGSFAAGKRGTVSKARKQQPLNIIFDSREPRPQTVGSVELDYPTAISYLRGEAIQLSGDVPRGIIEVSFMGHPLGQVKNIGNRANNLYPKEWRIKSTHIPKDYVPVLA